MARVNYKSRHNGSAYCPFVTAATQEWTPCIEDQCELWTINGDFSTCAINLIARQVDQLGYYASVKARHD